MLRELGSELREAREKRGVSIADAQAETKIRSRYLEALEQGRYDILPGDVYARGFLKSYAAYLGLNGQAYADRYKQWQDEQRAAEAESQAAAQARSRAPQARAPQAKAESAARPEPASKPSPAPTALAEPAIAVRPGRNLWVGLAVLLVASVIIGAWLAYRSGAAADAPPEPGQPVPGTGAAPGPGPGQPGTPTTPGNTGGAPVLTLEIGDVADFLVPVAIRDAGTGSLKLTVSANGACWIRLERPGLEPVEETLAAGTVRTWDFSGEARIKLGNPPGVRLKINDQSLPPSASANPLTYVLKVQ